MTPLGIGSLPLLNLASDPARGEWELLPSFLERAGFVDTSREAQRLYDFTFPFHFHALKKEMATHSSVLAWRIPGRGEPGGLPSMESHRVGHD